MGKQWKQWETLFSWAPKSLQMVTAAMKSKDACSLEEKLWKPRQHTKKQRHYLLTKVCIAKAMVFPVVMYRCESWTIKKAWLLENWCFWTVVLEKTLESPSDSKIKPINPKGNQPWISIGTTDAEAEVSVLWPPDAKNWLIGKDPDTGNDWGQEEKGTTGDKMVGWHHWLNGYGFGWTSGVGDGQGGLEYCNPWGFKESDTTE